MSRSEINAVNAGNGRILRPAIRQKLHSNALARIDASYIQAYRLTSWELNRDSLWKRGKKRERERETEKRERERERDIKQPSTFFFFFSFADAAHSSVKNSIRG